MHGYTMKQQKMLEIQQPRGVAAEKEPDPGGKIGVEQLDEAVTAQFLSEHLSRRPSLRPPWPLQAALKLLLTLLRAKGVIAERMPAATPVEEELRRFDAYMDHVRGLAAKTRSPHCCTVSRLLREQFGDQPIVIAAIAPEALRRFVACQSERYRSPGDTASMIAALRGYFRFRSACGDEVHALIGVLAYPMRWALSSLPQTLSSTEVERIEAVLREHQETCGSVLSETVYPCSCGHDAALADLRTLAADVAALVEAALPLESRR